MAPKNFYPKGGFVFREGESADYAYVLKEGSVEILKTSADGDLILATLSEPNTIFGEMALIDGAPRSASARASVDSKVDEVKQKLLKPIFNGCNDEFYEMWLNKAHKYYNDTLFKK